MFILIACNPEGTRVDLLMANTCAFSPSGAYVVLTSAFERDRWVYAIDQHANAAIPPPGLSPYYRYALWLDDDILFQYDFPPDSTLSLGPTTGQFVDFPNHIITDFLSLDSDQQRAIIEQTTANLTARTRRLDEQPSPDGRYRARLATITDSVGQPVVQASADAPVACDRGWKPDSSGFYFLDFAGKSTPDGALRFLAVPSP